MKAPLAIALVCLAVAGSGCDAVVGNMQFFTERDDFNAISDDSGANAGGTIGVTVCCPENFKIEVTCLNVVGNRATIGTEWVPDATGLPKGRFWYVEDNPGKDNDKLGAANAPPLPTTCPAPPTTIPANTDLVGSDLHVIDDFAP